MRAAFVLFLWVLELLAVGAASAMFGWVGMAAALVGIAVIYALTVCLAALAASR